MPFVQLSLTLDAACRADAEAALEAAGALAISLEDAADVPILEPAPGETPLWPRLVLSALFEAGCDRAGVERALAGCLDAEAVPASWSEVPDQEWTRAWMDRFEPMRFGRRLWIYPSTIEPPAQTDAVIVRLDPGLAFGTGTHPTTALCLEWLDTIEPAGLRVIDYGCGSGVLAVAALKLGAVHALGIDNDPQALVASRDNAGRNGVGARLDLALPEDCGAVSADVLVANILAGPLATLAPRFAALLAPGGRLAVSGILPGQEDELLARYGPGFERLHVTAREGWVRIDGVRRT
jgi:ribosomal protein L11 methyltransferase